MSSKDLDARAMECAIKMAEAGVREGHRPFGAVILAAGGAPLSFAYGTESPDDPTRHSEILAIKQACRRIGGLLRGCTIYSTHEPCHMCCGAIKHAHLSRVVWGSLRADLAPLFRQCDVSAMELITDTSHPPECRAGVLRGPCVELFKQELIVAVANAGGTRAREEDIERLPEEPWLKEW